jgi:hypothetical protein
LTFTAAVGLTTTTEHNMKPLTLILFVVLFASGLGCKLGSLLSAGEFSSEADHFSIEFPGGSSGVETQYGKAKNKYIAALGTVYSKDFDNRTDNFRSYEVNAFSLKTDPPNDHSSESTILTLGLNGWYGEPETTSKEVTINGMNALDSVRTITLGAASMTFREVVFWSDKEKMLYVLRIAATKKENVATQDAEDFVRSFRKN